MKRAFSLWTFLAVVAACGLLAATAQAQPGRGGPGGGGFGGGGFGGGFGGPGGGNDPFQLLQNEAIQEELEIVPDQETQIREITTEAREEMQTEMRKLMQELQTRLQEKYKGKLDKVLLPHQMDRLQQVQVQARGTEALRDAKVAADLGLSKDQQDKLTALADGFGPKIREVFTNREEGVDMRTKITEMRKELETQMLDVLTPSQRDQFAKLKGEAFDLEKLRGERGRGGFGGGDRGQGGERPRRPGGDAE